jgi:hypothetical protein
MARINIQVQHNFDGFIELGRGCALDFRNGIGQAIILITVDAVLGIVQAFTGLGHYYSPTSTPIDRAVPAIIFAAASMSFAFRSGILDSAIS